uniref:Uncharacterized protein n=1 Tax=Myotis myotis TaxID=51298 RepID=A0A7J7UD09_MYOMY|nr:hypothetical protein mMyoMyo1_008799 [Myotis myotis]
MGQGGTQGLGAETFSRSALFCPRESRSRWSSQTCSALRHSLPPKGVPWVGPLGLSHPTRTRCPCSSHDDSAPGTEQGQRWRKLNTAGMSVRGWMWPGLYQAEAGGAPGAAQPGCRGWCPSPCSVNSTRTCQRQASRKGGGRESPWRPLPVPVRMAA